MSDLQNIINLLEHEWYGLEWEPVDFDEEETKIKYQGIEEGLHRAIRIVREYMAEQRSSENELRSYIYGKGVAK